MSGTIVRRSSSRRKDRLNFRLDREIKERVVRAAAITGQEVSDFAVSTLNERATEIIERHANLILNSEDYNFFLDALMEARKPSQRSRDAARRYRQARRKSASKSS